MNNKCYPNKKYLDATLISGATRSGTTWLMEMLYTDNMQIIWEPTKYETLCKRWSKDFASKLGVIPYIPADAEWDEAEAYFNCLLNGNMPVEIDEHSHPLLLSNPYTKNRLLLKFCNINLLLPWLCRKFPIKPIVIIRDPYDVVISQLSHNGYKDLWYKYNIFEYDNLKYKDLFGKYARQISLIDSKISMLAHWWAIQHVELFKNTHYNSLWEVVFYEDLCQNPNEIVMKLISSFNIGKSVREIDYFKPSSTTVNYNKIKFENKHVKYIVNRVLEAYEIDYYHK